MLTALAASLIVSGCAASLPATTRAGPGSTAGASRRGTARTRPRGEEDDHGGGRASLRDPAAARYHWKKFPAVVAADSVNYCATVDAKSPFPAYGGHQAYIVEARLSGGKVASATMGLIAGGKDFRLVAKMCAKYGLDPNKRELTASGLRPA